MVMGAPLANAATFTNWQIAFLFTIKSFEKRTNSFDTYSYTNIYNLMNQQLAS